MFYDMSSNDCFRDYFFFFFGFLVIQRICSVKEKYVIELIH